MIPAHQYLDTSPFHASEKPLKFITYRAQREAVAFFQKTYSHENGLGLFYGPPLSGKTAAIRRFVDRLPEDAAAAIVDVAHLNSACFLQAITREFGVEMDESSINVMFNMVKVFAVQQTTKRHAPLLVIENIHAMNPETAHIICKLAQLKVQNQFALRLILMSDHALDRMIAAPALDSVSSRKTGEHELGAMTRAETAYFIDAKLRLAGVERPEMVLSAPAADELHDQSGGLPGLIDQFVLRRLSGPEISPVGAVEKNNGIPEMDDTPRLVISKNGKTVGTVALTKKRITIGRSDLSDVIIDHTYISRHHAMLMRSKGKTVLADLNSRNGTFVNSKKVRVKGLRHDDVISLGNHTIKLYDPGCDLREQVEDSGLADTATMKALTDIRRNHARENAHVLRTKSSAS